MPPAIANPRHRFVPILWSCKSTPTQGKYLHTYIHASHAQNVNTDHKKALHPLSLFWFLQKPTPRQGFKSKDFLWGLITNITARACGAGRPDREGGDEHSACSSGNQPRGCLQPVESSPRAQSEDGPEVLGKGRVPTSSKLRPWETRGPSHWGARSTNRHRSQESRARPQLHQAWAPRGVHFQPLRSLGLPHSPAWQLGPSGATQGRLQEARQGARAGRGQGARGLSERGAPPPAVLLSGAHPCAADLPPPQTSSQQVSPYCAPRWARAGVHRETGSRAGGAGAPGRLTEEKQEPEVTVVTSDLMGAGKSRTRGHGLQRSDNGAERLSQGGKERGRPGDSSLHQPWETHSLPPSCSRPYSLLPEINRAQTCWAPA